MADFGARQLAAEAVIVVDERESPLVLVACEGPRREELLAQPDAFTRLANSSDRWGLREASIQVVPLTFTDSEPVGTLYVLAGPPDRSHRPDMRSEHTQALARQIALVLCKPGCGAVDSERAGTGGGWLSELDALPSLPDAIGRLTPTVARGASELLGVTAGCLVVWDGERSILRALPGAFGTSDRALSDSISGPPTNPHSLTSRVFATDQPYMTNDASSDPSLHQQYVDVFRLRRVLAVPLTVGARRVGVLMVANKPAPFTVADVVALERLAPRIATTVQFALSIEKIRRSQRMERILAQAATDVASGKSVEDCLGPALRELGATTGSALAVLSRRTAAPVLWRGASVDAELEQAFLKAAQNMSMRAAGAYPHDVGDPGWAAAHAPVLFSNDLVAVVSLLRRNGMPFGSDEEESLGRLADIAALAWATDRYQRQVLELTRSRERARIADELHDHVAQIMFAAQIGLDSLLESDVTECDEERGRLVEIRGLLTIGEAAIRAVIDECDPGPQENLVRRLENTIAAVDDQFHVAVVLSLPDPESVAEVPRSVADGVVRIAHEATINAVKHAGQCRIGLTLYQAADALCLRVRDDGKGTNGPGFTSRHGVNSMRRAALEIGGVLDITAGPGIRGTQVQLTVPLEL
ncbi:GAF domain-containing sensor histidine kinase [Conexibacter sp. DBS9H8]|uniref:GAF domain-containing sensor histidine kinase n=1 Tax=Conexibacter sp. DBS9H8 TaxID=2937801 RepID=UPI00200F40C4|nr:GAF domain-containing protein [Conexibacter sp. DBS9H8]